MKTPGIENTFIYEQFGHSFRVIMGCICSISWSVIVCLIRALAYVLIESIRHKRGFGKIVPKSACAVRNRLSTAPSSGSMPVVWRDDVQQLSNENQNRKCCVRDTLLYPIVFCCDIWCCSKFLFFIFLSCHHNISLHTCVYGCIRLFSHRITLLLYSISL